VYVSTHVLASAPSLVQLDLIDLLKPVKRKDVTPRERFAKFLKRQRNGCILWTGAIDQDIGGYGRFHLKGDVKVLSHRYAYELAHGPIPDGLLIRHTCHNPACCNDKHMLLGTNADNVADKIAANRQRSALKKEQVQLIVKLHTERGHTAAQLAERFNVSQASILHLLAGKTWAKVTGIQFQPSKAHQRKREADANRAA